jgi:hypothetical protein
VNCEEKKKFKWMRSLAKDIDTFSDQPGDDLILMK